MKTRSRSVPSPAPRSKPIARLASILPALLVGTLCFYCYALAARTLIA